MHHYLNVASTFFSKIFRGQGVKEGVNVCVPGVLWASEPSASHALCDGALPPDYSRPID